MSESFLFNDLVGGDRKALTDSTLKDLDKRIEEFHDKLFDPKDADVTALGAGAVPGGLSAAQAIAVYKVVLNSILKKLRFDAGVTAGGATTYTSLPTEAKEQLQFLYDVQDILAKAMGSYLGEDLKADVGDQAETARDRIKQDPKDAFGAGNRQLAYKVSSALKLLLKDFGDQSTGLGSASALVASLKSSEDKIANAIKLLAESIGTKAAVPAGGNVPSRSYGRTVNRL